MPMNDKDKNEAIVAELTRSVDGIGDRSELLSE